MSERTQMRSGPRGPRPGHPTTNGDTGSGIRELFLVVFPTETRPKTEVLTGVATREGVRRGWGVGTGPAGQGRRARVGAGA